MNIVVDVDVSGYPYEKARRDLYSQGGEDGVIEFLLTSAGINSGYFVEFGAWDGKHLSNCAKLAEEGWSGCFIEGDETRFLDLKKNYDNSERILALNEYVETVGKNSLTEIFRRNSVPRNITVLSIDIDGNDYHVWESLEGYEPAICILEFNPTIPAQVAYVQGNVRNENFGSSLTALWQLGKRKGYELVAVTELNGFFMLRSLCVERGIKTYSPMQIKSTRYETYIFHGYDGRQEISGFSELLWHGVVFNSEELQVLPKDLQRFPVGQNLEYSRSMDDFKLMRKNREGSR